MPDVLLDTCAFAWSLQASNLVTPAARSAVANAAVVYLSPISLYEITQKVRLGKWAAMAPLAPYLSAVPYLGIVTMASLDAAVCTAAGALVWAHRDPFDRMIAATAMQLGCPLVSSDRAFDGIVARIW